MKVCAYSAVFFALAASTGCPGPKLSPASKFTSVGTTIGGAVAPPIAKDVNEAQVQPAGGNEKEKGKAGEKDIGEITRKIKYTADIKVICADLTTAEDDLKVALNKYKAIIAHSEISSSPGGPRSGSWRVRVPVAHFNDFRDAVLKLGEVEKNTSDSEDVTEEFYDLQNHIKNKLAEEESMRKLLDKSGDSLQNILLLRDKLAQIRDHINRQEGKLRLLANLTDLTTVTLAIREKRKYEGDLPPATSETPTFGMRVDRTFTETWDRFVAFLQYLVLAVIAAAPWLAFIVVLATPALIIIRRRKRLKPPPPVMTEFVEPIPPPSA